MERKRQKGRSGEKGDSFVVFALLPFLLLSTSVVEGPNFRMRTGARGEARKLPGRFPRFLNECGRKRLKRKNDRFRKNVFFNPRSICGDKCYYGLTLTNGH
jgi:hypothetical protein